MKSLKRNGLDNSRSDETVYLSIAEVLHIAIDLRDNALQTLSKVIFFGGNCGKYCAINEQNHSSISGSGKLAIWTGFRGKF